MSVLGTRIFKTEIGCTELTFEVGLVAQRADGSVIGRQGETVILATAVSAQEPARDQSFFPLTVDYREKLAAAGRIPGGYLRREARATEREILTSRLIDRTLRPLFPDGYSHTTQVTVTVLSHDPESDSQVLAINTAAAALMSSDIPWGGPAVGVRIVKREKDLQAFPPRSAREDPEIELVASFGRSGLIMVEGHANQADDNELMAALQFAHREVTVLLDTQEELRAEFRSGERVWAPLSIPKGILRQLKTVWQEQLDALNASPEKRDRERIKGALVDEVAERLSDAVPRACLESVFARFEKEAIRRSILSQQKRIDGRAFDEVRAISGGVGVLPRAHGSSLFTRGGTQALVTCTLGTGREELEYETLDGVKRERFYLHYSFPPYSVGEPGQARGPGRREIGHGRLARRALIPVLPSPETFPYTIRLDSEITQSNGSSSMATVCGGCLALMDAGVPITSPVAGVAMGLVSDDDNTVVLTDILGDEDHVGDMDFKIAGTAEGVTAIQMDSKIGALAGDVLCAAFREARKARLYILEQMSSMIRSPRSELGNHAPRFSRIEVKQNRVRELIGPGGRTIQELQNRTGAKIDIEKGGLITIYAPDTIRLQTAVSRVRALTSDAEIGKIYRGTIVGVHHFGTFVRLFGSVEGLLSAGEATIGQRPVGSTLLVRAMGVDQRGRIALSAVPDHEVNSSDIVDF